VAGTFLVNLPLLHLPHSTFRILPPSKRMSYNSGYGQTGGHGRNNGRPPPPPPPTNAPRGPSNRGGRGFGGKVARTPHAARGGHQHIQISTTYNSGGFGANSHQYGAQGGESAGTASSNHGTSPGVVARGQAMGFGGIIGGIFASDAGHYAGTSVVEEDNELPYPPERFFPPPDAIHQDAVPPGMGMTYKSQHCLNCGLSMADSHLLWDGSCPRGCKWCRSEDHVGTVSVKP
jgi:hypothetical protein